jgi:site-specific DNA-cytosine methylase
MPEATSRLPKYQKLNALALYSLELILDAWETPPALILFENVPRILSRGKAALRKAKRTLRERGYDVDLRTHDCGELGGLGQRRKRVLLVARHRDQAPSHLLRPPSRPLRSAGEVIFELPVPKPGSTEGGPMHALPRVSGLNWLRLAAIRSGSDWRDIPAAIRIGGPATQHAGKYGVTDPEQPAHTVIGQARTGKGWADIADPRVSGTGKTQAGLYGVVDGDGQSHTVMGAARAGSSSWASIADPRVDAGPAKQNGGFGVNDGELPAHAVLGEGTVRNTFASIADPRLGCSPRAGTMGVASSTSPGATVLGTTDIHNGQGAVVDPRVAPQHRGNYGVEDPDAPSSCVRGAHVTRTAPASVADRRGFEPTHQLIAGQPLSSTRDAWVAGDFELRGPELDTKPSGRPIHAIILAPDGCIHRPMTDLELAALQGLPVWHRPGDPAELEIGASDGRWLELRGNKEQRREQIGNAVPPATAQAIAEQALALLDMHGAETFALSTAGVWVSPTRPGTRPARPSPRRARPRMSGLRHPSLLRHPSRSIRSSNLPGRPPLSRRLAALRSLRRRRRRSLRPSGGAGMRPGVGPWRW